MSSPAALPSLPPQLGLTGSIARLTLHRPEAANRLSLADLAVLEGISRRSSRRHRSACWCCGPWAAASAPVSTCASCRARTTPAPGLRRWRTGWRTCARSPSAAWKAGVCGGGTDLALACDFRIGSPACEMFVPAVRLGLHYYGGAMRRCVQRLGLQAAKRLLLAAEPFSAAEMLACGFLTELSDAPAILCEALSERLAGFAPLALLPMKQHLNALARHRLDSQQLAADIAQSAAIRGSRRGRRRLESPANTRISGVAESPRAGTCHIVGKYRARGTALPPSPQLFDGTSVAKEPPRPPSKRMVCVTAPKAPGSPFAATSSFRRCHDVVLPVWQAPSPGHAQVQEAAWQSQPVCSPSCKELEAQLAARNKPLALTGCAGHGRRGLGPPVFFGPGFQLLRKQRPQTER